MRFLRLPLKDPRTVARDIPGISESLFPGLVPGLVAYLNRTKKELDCINAIPKSAVNRVNLNAAMLYEIAYVRAEKTMQNIEINEDDCIKTAIRRQSRYFDAVTPKVVTVDDHEVINLASLNLVKGLTELAGGNKIEIAPKIPGMEWIASSEGDFAFSNTLVEVKCTAKNFSANDYRQILFYWLLQNAYVLNSESATWTKGVLFNPRLNNTVSFEFNSLLKLVSGGRDLIETIELLQSIISSGRSKVI